ncbi:hypothetical protein J2Y54_001529 [Sphingomonas sp. BE123]|uniref:hypothetical protein n=1 Tax=Sphingomonas sp. BE123 TaxID=2817842 RepID=UPI00285FEF37|nr:hypothetical protein [Sphingomonas sp. BE123]MDR6852036.1 hypothetical protein [Sphingomonas sp. BE123]
MRIVAGLLGLLALAGCDGAPKKDQDKISNEAVAALTATGGAFDYRYAYKVPGSRVKAVVESHAAGCDKLGPARCRIIAMRYRVDDSNRIAATLSFQIDPAVARTYGEAATRVVVGAGGALIETEIAGADATAGARTNALVGRLRDQLANARASSDVRQQDRARRIQTALDVIAESAGESGETMATAPVLITYASGTPAPGLNGSADASFRDAGNTLVTSAAALAQALAQVSPLLFLLLLLLVGALGLRALIHRTAPVTAEGGEIGPYRDDAEAAAPSRNPIQRWFNRDDDNR